MARKIGWSGCGGGCPGPGGGWRAAPAASGQAAAAAVWAAAAWRLGSGCCDVCPEAAPITATRDAARMTGSAPRRRRDDLILRRRDATGGCRAAISPLRVEYASPATGGCTIVRRGQLRMGCGAALDPCGPVPLNCSRRCYEPPALRGVVDFFAAPRAGRLALGLAPPSPFSFLVRREAARPPRAGARRRSSASSRLRRRLAPLLRRPCARLPPSSGRTRCRRARSGPPRPRRPGGAPSLRMRV